MAVMIVGLPDDVPSRIIYDKVTQRGVEAVYFDTTHMPTVTMASYAHLNPPPEDCFYQGAPGEKRIPLSEFTAVYRRWSKGVKAPSEPDPMLNEVVYWNIESFVISFLKCMRHCRWVNTQEATEMHKYKPYQLQLLHEAGIRIPETRITNDPQMVHQFYELLGGNVVFKPVRGWAHTEALTPKMMTPEALEMLSRSPITLQEKIEGTDIRVYVVDGEVFAMEIQADTLDFREDADAPRVPITLPDAVIQDCHTICQTLDLVFTGIDCRRTPAGEYVFFEANPTPLFAYDETSSGYPISDRLVETLLK